MHNEDMDKVWLPLGVVTPLLDDVNTILCC